MRDIIISPNSSSVASVPRLPADGACVCVNIRCTCWPSESKLHNVGMTFELARRLAASGRDICVYACHPGVLSTALWRDDPFGSGQGVWNMCCACKPTCVAANTVSYLASGHGTCGIRHGYFQGCVCVLTGEYGASESRVFFLMIECAVWSTIAIFLVHLRCWITGLRWS